MLFISLAVLRGAIPWSYSGFVLSASLMIAYNNGTVISLIPDGGELQYRLFPVFAALLITFQARFVQVTFLSRALSPLLYRSYAVFTAIPLLCAVPLALFAPSLGILSASPIALLMGLLLILSTVRAYQLKTAYRGLLLLTTSLGLLPVAVMMANNYFVLNMPLDLHEAFSISWASQAVVMSLVTTLKLNVLKQEAENSRQQVVVAEAEQRAAQEFLAKMSHEIRTPINGVIGMSELLSKTDLATEQKYYNNIVLGSGKLLLSIINDVLDYSKLSAGAMSIEQTEFNLADILCETCMLFTTEAKQKKLSIPLRIEPQIPVALIGDPFRLKQVIANLLSNGIKFTDAGSVSLTVTGVSQSEHKVRLLFSVEDTGIGITEDLHQQLFEAFTQASKGTSRKYGGTGLGLPISAQLVKLMGGELKIRSQEHRGSCFYFECSFAIDAAGEQERIEKIAPLRQYHLLLATHIPVFIDAYRDYFEYFDIHCDYIDDLNILRDKPALFEQADLLITEFYTAQTNSELLIDLQPLCNTPIALLQPLQFIESPLNLGRAVTQIVPCPFHQLAYFMCQLIQERGKTSAKNLSRVETSQAINKQLLVAEDNLVNQQVIGALLKKLGLTFQLAENGRQAVALYEQCHNDFDLVLMDCEMPEMDGYSASQAIREYEQQNQLPAKPIVALTANVLSSAKQQCINSGMNAVLTKPIRFDDLKQGLQAVLGEPGQYSGKE
jgi:signal transduction histidine kinase/ActR/RegA family two-component response regulator